MKSKKWLVFLLLLIGLGIRMIAFSNPPLDFHPARQFHSAIMARGFYLKTGGQLPSTTPEFEHEAMMRGMQENWIEPPIMEFLTAQGYHLIGDADLRIPRALSILFWLIGGIGIWRLTKRIIGDIGGLTALGFWLFFPYGILASRSFQPDPLMCALMAWALVILLSWHERPTWIRAVGAGFLAGMAILVKQVAVFPLSFAFGIFFLRSLGIKKSIQTPQLWLIALLAALPVAAYNLWGVFGSGFLAQQFQGRFFFSEWGTVGFYIRWLRKIDEVFTIPLFVISLIGCFIIANKQIRALFAGFFIGYLAYGLALPHHIGTHDYYQLILFPLIAVGVGQIADMIFHQLTAKRIQQCAALLCLIGLSGWWLLDSAITLRRVDYHVWQSRWQELATKYDPYPGQISVIGLMDDYGAGMMYYAVRTPEIWDQNAENIDENDANQLFSRVFGNRDTLIVTDLPRFYAQPCLQRWLQTHATPVELSPDYLVYALDWEE